MSYCAFGQTADLRARTMCVGGKEVIDSKRNVTFENGRFRSITTKGAIKSQTITTQTITTQDLIVNGVITNNGATKVKLNSINIAGNTFSVNIENSLGQENEYQAIYAVNPETSVPTPSDETGSLSSLPLFDSNLLNPTFTNYNITPGTLIFHEIYDGPDVATAALIVSIVLKFERIGFKTIYSPYNYIEWSGTDYVNDFFIYSDDTSITNVGDAANYLGNPFLSVNSATGFYEGLISPYLDIRGDIDVYEVYPDPDAFVALFQQNGDWETQLNIVSVSDYTIDWGDGSVVYYLGTGIREQPQFNYTAGIYRVVITGNVTSAIYYRQGEEEQWLDLLQWGNLGLTQIIFTRWSNFRNTIMTKFTAGSPPASLTNWSDMFYGCANVNPDTSDWDSSLVTDMKYMFSYTDKADPDVSNWNTSNVTGRGFEGMFYTASVANPDVSNWDTSGATDFDYMFALTQKANPDVSNWSVPVLVDARSMFENALAANPDISNWDAPLLEIMDSMFAGTLVANPTFGPQWLTNIEVRDVDRIFKNAKAANVDMTNVPHGLWQFQNNMIDGAPLWSQANYDILITKWRDFPFTASFAQNQGTEIPVVPGYTSGGIVETYYIYLDTTRSWTFVDGGPM